MRDALGKNTWLGYCTNVHAGATYAQMLANLETHALAVKRRVAPDQPLGIGLWLSATAARQVIAENRQTELRDWLNQRGLAVFTLNGFPFGDFHREIVKHDVYLPDWADPRRVQYTHDLISILATIVTEGAEGSISTLPLGWGHTLATQPDRVEQAAKNLRELAHHLAKVKQETGRLIHVDLEPEPGCFLQYTQDVLRFFTAHLLRGSDAETVRTHIRVCHDVCHSAVMFEPQAEVLAQYRKAGIKVGKVQISSAVSLPFEGMPDEARHRALSEIARFSEDRYLHQTVVRYSDGRTRFFEDLPGALAEQPGGEEWRVHFHVPIYLERFGSIASTRSEITRCLAAILPEDQVHHFEAETYAWGVLPAELRQQELAEGIARELQWLIQR